MSSDCEVRICSECGSAECSVVESRKMRKYARRRLRCDSCGHRWTTYEIKRNPVELEALAYRMSLLLRKITAFGAEAEAEMKNKMLT
jgi:hypothetical protein